MEAPSLLSRLTSRPEGQTSTLLSSTARHRPSLQAIVAMPSTVWFATKTSEISRRRKNKPAATASVLPFSSPVLLSA